MVSDPCGADLVPGLYGTSEGLLARTKVGHNLSPGTFAPITAGYALWCPDFSNTKSIDTPGNVYIFVTDNSSDAPANNELNNNAFFAVPTSQGATALTNTAFHIGDPAAALLESTTVADARCLSACMTMTYLGRMRDSSGEMCFIQNLPLSELLTGRSGDLPVSVDQLFTYSSHKNRLGIDTIETVYRPNTLSTDHFRTSQQSPLLLDLLQVPLRTKIEPTIASYAPRVFGFVWRNTEGNAPFSFDFIKNIEWRPEVVSGFTQVPMTVSGPSRLETTLAYLDRLSKSNPNVWNRILGGASSVGAAIAKLAYTGTQQRRLL